MRGVRAVVAIGYKNVYYNKLVDEITQKKLQIELLEHEVSELRVSLNKLHQSELPIKLFAVAEKHHWKWRGYLSTVDTHHIVVYYYPDFDKIEFATDMGIYKAPFPCYSNELDLIGKYAGVPEKIDAGEDNNAIVAKKYSEEIGAAVDDIRTRIEKIIVENSIDSWEIVGKKLIETYS